MMARFQETFCSQCGGSFGPGDSGFSHCSSHRYADPISVVEANLRGEISRAEMWRLIDNLECKS